MARQWNAQNMPANVSQLIEQLERHCLAPDGSYLSKSAYSELHLAGEEMSRERLRYSEALSVYGEAIGMVEEYQQAISTANHGGVRDHQTLYPHFGLTCSPQVIDQILEVLIKFIMDLKLQHQHEFDELRKTWLCKRCQTMNAKLRVLEHLLLRDTYTKESVPALHRIRKYLVEATEEASIAYNKAVTRLREYQGVDPYFDSIARQYNDIVKKLEGMQWTIHQVEMDLKRSLDQSAP